jgi:hypothetical protein
MASRRSDRRISKNPEAGRLEIKCRAKREKPDEPLESQDYSHADGAVRLSGRQLQPDF